MVIKSNQKNLITLIVTWDARTSCKKKMESSDTKLANSQPNVEETIVKPICTKTYGFTLERLKEEMAEYSKCLTM